MAHVKQFSYREAFGFGWETTKKYFWFLLVLFLISSVVQFIISYGTTFFFEEGDAAGQIAGFLFSIAGWIVALELSFAKTGILLMFIDRKKPKFSDLFNFFEYEILLRYLLVSVIYGIIVFFGFLLFVVPGVYWGIKYGFAAAIYVDKRKGIWESFEKSSELTKGVKWRLLGFGLMQCLILFAGALLFGVGLFFAIPVVYVAEMYVYRKLYSHHHPS